MTLSSNSLFNDCTVPKYGFSFIVILFSFILIFILFKQLKYKGLLNGIEVVITEESYTSKASFFDKDEVPIYDPNEKQEYTFSGKRIKRGLYKDSKGNIYNADLNGAGNIMRKVSDKAYRNIRKTKELMKRPILVTL